MAQAADSDTGRFDVHIAKFSTSFNRAPSLDAVVDRLFGILHSQQRHKRCVQTLNGYFQLQRGLGRLRQY